MADSQERQLILTETISKKLDEIIERQKKLEDENVRLRKENENLKAPSRREKAPRRRRSKVLIPDDLPKRFRKVYNLLSEQGHIEKFFLDEHPDSDNNQKILKGMCKELKQQNGGDRCTWTDMQIEAQFNQYFKSKKDQEVRKRKGTDNLHRLSTKRTRRINAKLERRQSGYEMLKNTLTESCKGMVEEVLDSQFMSSEESDIEEAENGKKTTKGYIVKPIKWERTKLISLKEMLDEAYDKNLSPHAVGLKKPRKVGGDWSTRRKPSGPAWAVRLD